MNGGVSVSLSLCLNGNILAVYTCPTPEAGRQRPQPGAPGARDCDAGIAARGTWAHSWDGPRSLRVF